LVSETTLSPNYNALCPEVFQDLVPNSEFCYMISKVANVSWGDADSECMEYDSRLTSIHNMEENDIITDLFRNESIDIWIGLQQNGIPRLGLDIYIYIYIYIIICQFCTFLQIVLFSHMCFTRLY
jgi:hypothetical protein